MLVYEKNEGWKPISFEDLLKKFGRTEDEIEKIYHGKDHWCRCGCGGNYFYRGVETEKRGFNRALSSLKKETFESFDIEYHDYGGGAWLNIPKANQDNKCYCIYFKQKEA
jgi:hypothetical protein